VHLLLAAEWWVLGSLFHKMGNIGSSLGLQGPLAYWLFGVGLLSLFGTLNGFRGTLHWSQFSKKKEQVTPFSQRVFGVWTLVAGLCRLQCAFALNEPGIQRVTIATFLIALGFYVHEVFIAQTAPFGKAIPPFIVAATSAIWMLFLQ